MIAAGRAPSPGRRPRSACARGPRAAPRRPRAPASLASSSTSPVSRSTTSATRNGACSRSASLDRRRRRLLPFVELLGHHVLGERRCRRRSGSSRGGRGPGGRVSRSCSSTCGGTVRVELALALEPARAIGAVELAQDRLVGLEAEGAQEHGAVELALAVDAHRQDVLLVVLELHPRAAVGDDLGEEGARPLLGEEDARAAVELRDDDALGAVDDEGAVVASSAGSRRSRPPPPWRRASCACRSRGPCRRRRAGR